jgi:hypothetical protein
MELTLPTLARRPLSPGDRAPHNPVAMALPDPHPPPSHRAKPYAVNAGGGGAHVHCWGCCWVVLVRSCSPLAPTPSAGINRPRPLSPLMLLMYVSIVSDVSEAYCNNFI